MLERGADALRERCQHLVAHHEPALVVHVLEQVDVDETDAERLAALVRSLRTPAEHGQKARARERPGKRVVGRECLLNHPWNAECILMRSVSLPAGQRLLRDRVPRMMKAVLTEDRLAPI